MRAVSPPGRRSISKRAEYLGHSAEVELAGQVATQLQVGIGALIEPTDELHHGDVADDGR